MKKMALLLLLATFGIAICQEELPGPAAQPQRDAKEEAEDRDAHHVQDRPNRPGRGQGRRRGRHLEQMVKRYEEVAGNHEG